MSLDLNEGKNENKNEEQINNEPEPEDNDDKYVETTTNFVLNNIKDDKKDGEDNINISKKDKEKSIIETSALALMIDNDQKKNDILNQINNQDIQSNNTNDLYDNNTNPKSTKQSFMQRTKTWMSNMWTNVKNFDYGKYNIFKKTEMEDILDAHGNHIKIPKKRQEKKLEKIKENNEDFMKYNNLQYNSYYEASNMNVFVGYPF